MRPLPRPPTPALFVSASNVSITSPPPALTLTPTLAIRLPNHLGDVCMCVPALDLLAQHFSLMLVGKPWIGSLFADYGWPVVALNGSGRAQRSELRRQRKAQGTKWERSALLFTHSFGSALQLRLAGLRPRGYATEGRSLLLSRALPVPARWASDMHTVEYYLELAARAFDLPPVAPPTALRLRVSEAAQHHAYTLVHSNRNGRVPYVVLCPLAVGLHQGKVKAWNGFGRLCEALRARGVRVVAMPGPGELDAVRAAVPTATVLPASNVGTFAALLAGARLVVANDSGPGHLAAAVGTPLVSVFGVTDPLKTRPWGERVTLLGGKDGWPDYAAVEAAVLAALGPMPLG